MKSKWNIIALLGMMMLIAAPAAGQPASFLVDGYVNCTNGDPVNDPIVTVTNLNTSEVFITETNVSSNYYQVMTSSLNVSAGNVLHFNVSSSEFDHPVTPAEMDAGGFGQNATIECEPAGICGDVDGIPGVTMNDGRQIFMNIIYGSAQYPIHDPWAADCDGLCDGMTMNDGRQIFMNIIYGEEAYPLACCE